MLCPPHHMSKIYIFKRLQIIFHQWSTIQLKRMNCNSSQTVKGNNVQCFFLLYSTKIKYGIRTERSFSKNFCSQYLGMFDYYTVLKAKDFFFNIKYRQHNANKTFKILQY